ncbi:MAG: RNA polymerase sigma factor [Thermoleophilia bacterium]
MSTEESLMRLRPLLIHLGRNGSAESESAPDFDALYRRYLKPVYAYLAYRVDDRLLAEDLASQVFEKAWRGLDRFDPGKSSISTWLFTIARNCLTDHFRSQGNRPLEVELPLDFEAGGADGQAPSAQSQIPVVEIGERALELRGELRRALGRLGDREREIVSLKFGGSMTNRKIAQLLDISESNVGTILYRSLNKMKTQLEGGIKND